MLQFRTTRVAGAKILVDYDTDDIVRLRKTKSIDLMLWHTNGLALDMVDGEVSWEHFFMSRYIVFIITNLSRSMNRRYILKMS